MKRILSVLLTVALILTLLPVGFGNTAQAATGTFFIFPNEQYDVSSPKLVNSDRLTVNGTLNGVNGNSITYSVYQLNKKSDGTVSVVNKNEGQEGNVTVTGSNISIYNIQLYPGLNRITFKGQQGTSQVEDSIYVDYRNGPTLYDLKANLADGSTAVELKEDETAILMAREGTPSYGQASTDISISGVAPSASKVTVEVNGRSWTYDVSSFNDYKFFASPINVKSGKNIVKIKVSNATQTIETTRELTFYNGKVTFYDVQAVHGTAVSSDLSAFPDFSVSDENVSVKGKIIVPIQNGVIPDAAQLQSFLGYEFTNGATGSGTTRVTIDRQDSNYMEVSFNNISPATIEFGKLINLRLTVASESVLVGMTLRNSGTAYIHELNYLSGYSEGMSGTQITNLTGTPLDGANLYSLPIAVEILVANGGSIDTINAVDKNGNSLATSALGTGSVIRNINGNQVELKRIIVRLDKLPSTGQQKVDFRIPGASPADIGSKSATVTMLYGPYVEFTSLYDGQQIQVDTNQIGAMDTVLRAMDNFNGQLLNIPNTDEIDYSSTVMMYVNNTRILLTPTSNSTKTKFTIATGEIEKAYKAMFPGENTIKFVFKSDKSSYEKVMKVSLVPLNVPVIPAPNTLGVFPYGSATTELPKAADPNFEANGSVYLTKEKTMNVFGTFDFLDLGTTASAVQGNLSTVADKSKYILKITTPGADGKDVNYTWNLGNTLLAEDGTAISGTVNNSPLKVYYNYDRQDFSFVLGNQEVPGDGSPKVYNITVYNNGEAGPSATYRLEVTYVTTPFNIIRPLAEKRIVNQNFVEVIIASDNASSVMVGKTEAEKFSYDMDYDGIADYPNAYRALVKDLKANKDTKIEVTVMVGEDELTDTITVRYVPTNIPGAQYMDVMKSSHKVFDGALSLSFEKGTSLIRRDFNVPEQFKGQVYSNHDIRFAIANSDDGVVDRRDFESKPANYDNELAMGKQLFIGNFQQRFIKTSPVFWIDAGRADDISTTDVYDPITSGADPYQIPGSEISSYYNREPLNELVPSKRGTLTLSYNESVTSDSGRLVTVFRFDPELKKWENIGGVVDAKKHTIEVPFDRFGYYVVAKLGYSYNDIVQHPYGRDFIETIFAKGVMNAADPSSQFGTDSYVTRAEFVRMLVKAKNLPLNYSGAKHFSDIPSTMDSVNPDALWDFRYIETAARSGITRGTQPQIFDANSMIKRQDAAVMIASALNLKLETDREKVKKDLQKYFKDYASIDYYAQPSVLAIAKKGFIAGSPVDSNDLSRGYMFNPTARTLRGDAAIIIARVMADQKLLPKM